MFIKVKVIVSQEAYENYKIEEKILNQEAIATISTNYKKEINGKTISTCKIELINGNCLEIMGKVKLDDYNNLNIITY